MVGYILDVLYLKLEGVYLFVQSSILSSCIFLTFPLGPKAQLMLRYPDGKREQITLPEQAKLLVSISNWIHLLEAEKLIGIISLMVL